MTMLRERDVLLHPSWTGDARKVLDRAADRHGGWTAWRTLGPLHVVCTRFEGALARLKGHGKTFQFGEAVVQPREQTVDIKPARPAGLEIAYRQGRLHWTEPGDPIVRRTAALPRNRFSGLRRLARWDEQDSAYFEGYVLSTYYGLPFHLGAAACLSIRPRRWRNRVFDVVTVRFPETFHTHTAVQKMWFAEDGLLCRLDYHADIVGRIPATAHTPSDYKPVGGVLQASRRLIRARLFGRPIPVVILDTAFEHCLSGTSFERSFFRAERAYERP